MLSIVKKEELMDEAMGGPMEEDEEVVPAEFIVSMEIASMEDASADRDIKENFAMNVSKFFCKKHSHPFYH